MLSKAIRPNNKTILNISMVSHFLKDVCYLPVEKSIRYQPRYYSQNFQHPR